ncbi:unnamed protein product [Ranitomeya imitator]|uniref:Uncharacterized protein n=1 Tax=Ranitomeya imitator TaxID=111125 RepID=A0ABN9LZX9_9NEOB|nr:unnamed protein product [Ranitomeya imitator]
MLRTLARSQWPSECHDPSKKTCSLPLENCNAKESETESDTVTSGISSGSKSTPIYGNFLLVPSSPVGITYSHEPVLDFSVPEVFDSDEIDYKVDKMKNSICISPTDQNTHGQEGSDNGNTTVKPKDELKIPDVSVGQNNVDNVVVIKMSCIHCFYWRIYKLGLFRRRNLSPDDKQQSSSFWVSPLHMNWNFRKSSFKGQKEKKDGKTSTIKEFAKCSEFSQVARAKEKIRNTFRRSNKEKKKQTQLQVPVITVDGCSQSTKMSSEPAECSSLEKEEEELSKNRLSVSSFNQLKMLLVSSVYWIHESSVFLHHTSVYWIRESSVFLHHTSVYWIRESSVFLHHTSVYWIRESSVFLHHTSVCWIRLEHMTYVRQQLKAQEIGRNLLQTNEYLRHSREAYQGLSKRNMASDLNSSQFCVEKVKQCSFPSELSRVPKQGFTPTYGVSAYSGQIGQ